MRFQHVDAGAHLAIARRHQPLARHRLVIAGDARQAVFLLLVHRQAQSCATAEAMRLRSETTAAVLAPRGCTALVSTIT